MEIANQFFYVCMKKLCSIVHKNKQSTAETIWRLMNDHFFDKLEQTDKLARENKEEKEEKAERREIITPYSFFSVINEKEKWAYSLNQRIKKLSIDNQQNYQVMLSAFLAYAPDFVAARNKINLDYLPANMESIAGVPLSLIDIVESVEDALAIIMRENDEFFEIEIAFKFLLKAIPVFPEEKQCEIICKIDSVICSSPYFSIFVEKENKDSHIRYIEQYINISQDYLTVNFSKRIKNLFRMLEQVSLLVKLSEFEMYGAAHVCFMLRKFCAARDDCLGFHGKLLKLSLIIYKKFIASDQQASLDPRAIMINDVFDFFAVDATEEDQKELSQMIVHYLADCLSYEECDIADIRILLDYIQSAVKVLHKLPKKYISESVLSLINSPDKKKESKKNDEVKIILSYVLPVFSEKEEISFIKQMMQNTRSIPLLADKEAKRNYVISVLGLIPLGRYQLNKLSSGDLFRIYIFDFFISQLASADVGIIENTLFLLDQFIPFFKEKEKNELLDKLISYCLDDKNPSWQVYAAGLLSVVKQMSLLGRSLEKFANCVFSLICRFLSFEGLVDDVIIQKFFHLLDQQYILNYLQDVQLKLVVVICENYSGRMPKIIRQSMLQLLACVPEQVWSNKLVETALKKSIVSLVEDFLFFNHGVVSYKIKENFDFLYRFPFKFLFDTFNLLKKENDFLGDIYFKKCFFEDRKYSLFVICKIRLAMLVRGGKLEGEKMWQAQQEIVDALMPVFSFKVNKLTSLVFSAFIINSKEIVRSLLIELFELAKILGNEKKLANYLLNHLLSVNFEVLDINKISYLVSICLEVLPEVEARNYLFGDYANVLFENNFHGLESYSLYKPKLSLFLNYQSDLLEKKRRNGVCDVITKEVKDCPEEVGNLIARFCV